MIKLTMAVDIFIVRHGQNVDNANNILNGRRDLPLTELGRKQARELGDKMAKLKLNFDVVYSSPLIRAFETATILSEILGNTEKPVVVPDLIERDFGIMTGQPISQIVPMCGTDILVTDSITYFLKPEGAETFPHLMRRADKVLREIRDRQKAGKALIVTHGDLGKMIYAVARNLHWKTVLREFHFGNGDLIDINPNNSTHVIKLEQFNL